MSVFGSINPSTFTFVSVPLRAAHVHLQPFLSQLTAVCWEMINSKAWICKWIIISKLCKNNANFITFGVTEAFVISCPIYFLLVSLMAEITRCQIKPRAAPSPFAMLEHWWWLVRAVPFSWQMTGHTCSSEQLTWAAFVLEQLCKIRLILLGHRT